MGRKLETTQFSSRIVSDSEGPSVANPGKTDQYDHREWFTNCKPGHNGISKPSSQIYNIITNITILANQVKDIKFMYCQRSVDW